MQLRKISIGRQLALGLGCLLLLTLTLGPGHTWWPGSRLTACGEPLRGLYDHLLQVRTALGKIEADILLMHRNMLALNLTTGCRGAPAHHQGDRRQRGPRTPPV